MNQRTSPIFPKVIMDKLFSYRESESSFIYKNQYHTIVLDKRRFGGDNPQSQRIATIFEFEGNLTSVKAHTDASIYLQRQNLFFS